MRLHQVSQGISKMTPHSPKKKFKNFTTFLLQDTGACVALMHVRIYYMFCPEVTKNLAIFPATTSGSEVTSLVEAKGVCVPFASQVSTVD